MLLASCFCPPSLIQLTAPPEQRLSLAAGVHLVYLLLCRLFSFFTLARSFQLTLAVLFLTKLHWRQRFHLVGLAHAPCHRRAAMAATGTIPLHCNICPKKPNFSDVSHLLTHVASKGHLSNYYKARVRSSSEDDSRSLVDAYDQWYAEWNVETLMSERMNQKEKRRARIRPAGITFAPFWDADDGC